MEKSEIKPYNALSNYLKEKYGTKIYKLSLNGNMTCPNRDGTLGTKGCIFCGEQGSGDFTANKNLSITKQIEEAKKKVPKKIKNGKYIAYFQAFTNTYAPLDYLKKIFTEAINHPDIAILSIATRPDCLPENVIELLDDLNKIKPVWIEIGLQTIHEQTAEFIRRGYSLPVFDKALKELTKRNIQVIAHVIIGLPYETEQMIYETIDYLSMTSISGIKLHLLHVLKNTDLAVLWEKKLFNTLTKEKYIDILIGCIERLPKEVVIHRITGDGAPKLLLAPDWSRYKWSLLNDIHSEMKARGSFQGRLFNFNINKKMPEQTVI